MTSGATGEPHTFGWLRRGDCERLLAPLRGGELQIWERPDGATLYAHDPRLGRLRVRRREDGTTEPFVVAYSDSNA